MAKHTVASNRVKIEQVDEDLKTVEGAIKTLNREMGEVLGELRAIKWLLGGGIVAGLVMQFLL